MRPLSLLPAILTAACTLAPASVRALDGALPLTAYHHTIWGGKEGAPGEVAAMAQTRDGWLWIGAADGLYRFDGVRFRRFEPLAGDPPARRLVTALTALPDGGLLVGHQSGALALLRQGHLRYYPTEVEGQPLGAVSSAVTGEDGVLWAATGSGLLRLEQERWRRVDAAMGLGGRRVSNLTRDQYGQLWVAEGRRLYVLARGAQRFRPVLDEIDPVNLIESPDGRLWLDTHERLVPVPPQHNGPLLPRPAWLAQAEGMENGLFDRDGNYWSLLCPVGLCRASGAGLAAAAEQRPNSGPRDRLDQPWQMGSLTANVLFEDSEGGIWVGTQNGVERFRHNRLLAQALEGGEYLYSFARAPDGGMLVLTAPNGQLWSLRGGAARLLEQRPRTMFGIIANAANGDLLIAGADAIERRGAGGATRIAYPDGVAQAGRHAPVVRLMDDGDCLWIWQARRSAWCRRDGRWLDHQALGLPAGNALFAAPGAPGEMWLAYAGQPLLRYRRGVLARYAPPAGLGAITFLHAGDALLVGGENGMAAFLDGRFQRLLPDDAETLHAVSGMAIAPNGDRWFNGHRGALRVTAAAWAAFKATPGRPLAATLYGVMEGYPGAATTSARRATAAAGPDGQLWFAGSGGLAWLDSNKEYARPAPPLVKIETLSAQGLRHQDFGYPVLLPAGASAVRIEYTALSYPMAEGLQFRYLMEGVDSEWQQAGARRAISYSSLKPGEYRFRVAAVDPLGQASSGEDSLRLRIPPTFTQSHWFTGLCLLLAVGAAYGLHRLRLRQATLRLDERLAERERIARTLHDSFLQGVQGLILSFHSTLHGLPHDAPQRQRLERALAMAERVMEEGRDQVHELRTFVLHNGDLRRALALVGEVLQESRGVAFRLDTAGHEIRLTERASAEVYGIAREAIMNAFRHADAQRIVVLLSYLPDQFTLRVQDDGKGLPPAVLAGQAPRGHWGLTGMRERTARLGGTLSVGPGPDGAGTSVALALPAPAAYGIHRRWRPWRR